MAIYRLDEMSGFVGGLARVMRPNPARRTECSSIIACIKAVKSGVGRYF